MSYIFEVINLNFCQHIFRSLIPLPQDRVPLDSHTWPHLLSPLPPIFFMAYLARRPNTYYLRLMSLPVTIFCCLRAGFGFVWLEARLNVCNYVYGQSTVSISSLVIIADIQKALFSTAIISRALEFGLTVKGMKKINENIVGENTKPAVYRDDKARHPLSRTPLDCLLPQSFENAIELLCSIRGIGFEHGKGVVIPLETRPLEKGPFLRATVILFIRSFLTLDILESLLKLTPPLKTPLGGTIFIPSLRRFERYVVSTIIHAVTGFGLLEGLHTICYLCPIISVGVLDNPPAAWPPVSDHPWRSHSLQDFWSRRWHQILRRTFMVFGGLPGKWIGNKFGQGQLGMLFGTFMASGLYHEIPAYALGRGLDWRVPAFFLPQAFLVLAERLWGSITGKKVEGWWGRMWAYFAVLVLGQNLGKLPLFIVTLNADLDVVQSTHGICGD